LALDSGWASSAVSGGDLVIGEWAGVAAQSSSTTTPTSPEAGHLAMDPAGLITVVALAVSITVVALVVLITVVALAVSITALPLVVLITALPLVVLITALPLAVLITALPLTLLITTRLECAPGRSAASTMEVTRRLTPPVAGQASAGATAARATAAEVTAAGATASS
jgi:hypothetical protein